MRLSRTVLTLALVAATATAFAQAARVPSQQSPYPQDDRGQQDDGSMQDGQGQAPTPEQQAEMAALGRYQHALEASLRASASPRDWALSAALMHSDEQDGPDSADAARGALLRKAAESAPDDRLVQWLWALAPAEISGCVAANPCRHRGSALAKLEPDNAAAWLPAITDAVRFNDAAGIDDALAHMAAATRYDEVFHDSLVAWMDIFRHYPMTPELMRMPDGKAGDPTLAAAAAVFAEIAIATPAYEDLMHACDRQAARQVPASRFDNCARIGRLMIDRSTTIMPRMMGADLLTRSGTPSPEDRDRIRTAAWQTEQHMRLAQAAGSDMVKARAQLDLLLASDSEVAAMHEELRRAQVSPTPPAGWQPKLQNGPQGPAGEGPPQPGGDQRR